MAGAGEGGRFYSVDVYQASGMMAAQLGCTPDDALGRLEFMAAATNQSIEDIAAAILDGSLRFDD